MRLDARSEVVELNADLSAIPSFLRKFLILALLMIVVGSLIFAILTIVFQENIAPAADGNAAGGGWRLFLATFIPFTIGGAASAGSLYVATRFYLLHRTRQCLRALIGRTT